MLAGGHLAAQITPAKRTGTTIYHHLGLYRAPRTVSPSALNFQTLQKGGFLSWMVKRNQAFPFLAIFENTKFPKYHLNTLAICKKINANSKINSYCLSLLLPTIWRKSLEFLARRFNLFLWTVESLAFFQLRFV